jgi:hypothetical protein
VNGNVVFSNNTGLLNLKGLNGFKFVTGNFEILECDNLLSLEGLENLVSLYGNLMIYYNPLLVNYCALHITNFNGTAYIGFNGYNPSYANIKAGKCSP